MRLINKELGINTDQTKKMIKIRSSINPLGINEKMQNKLYINHVNNWRQRIFEWYFSH